MASAKVSTEISQSDRFIGKFARLNVLVVVVSLFWAIGVQGGLLSTRDSLAAMEKDEWSTSQHELQKRHVTPMVPIRDRERTSLCHYEVLADVNLQRIPDKIDRVLCKKESCKCTDNGDYRCTQLYTQLNVTYFTGSVKLATEFELITVEYACVCSKSPKSLHVNLFEPDIV